MNNPNTTAATARACSVVERTSALPRITGHLPALDGLRGVALLAVMVYHFFLFSGILHSRNLLDRIVSACAEMGWCGVDLFFVLSGFLITGILYDTRQRKGYFRTFYTRRVLRIFPLYYACLAFYFLILPVLDRQGAVERVPASVQLWLWAYLSNIPVALHGWSAVPPHVGHFWSLAVEEQFYLAWPLIVFFPARRTLVGICAVLTLEALAFRVWCHGHGFALAAYVMLPARVDALAVGAALALLLRDPGDAVVTVRWSRRVFVLTTLLLGLLLVARKGLSLYDVWVGTVGFSLLAFAFGSALVVCLTAPEGALVTRVLTSAFLRFFGKYSYALYVMHHVIALALPEFGLSAMPAYPHGGTVLFAQLVYMGTATALSVVAALLSWHLWEKHFLTLKERFAKYSTQMGSRAVAEEKPAALEG